MKSLTTWRFRYRDHKLDVRKVKHFQWQSVSLADRGPEAGLNLPSVWMCSQITKVILLIIVMPILDPLFNLLLLCFKERNSIPGVKSIDKSEEVLLPCSKKK